MEKDTSKRRTYQYAVKFICTSHKPQAGNFSGPRLGTAG